MHDDLRWLVIPQRVQYKLAVTVHRCFCHRAPWYLADYWVPVRSSWVSADAWRPALAGCCDSPSLSSPPSSSQTTVCQSPKFLVASICDLPDVINCQFCKFAVALSGTMHFLSPDQQSGSHCLIICAIQLLTPYNLAGSWRRICSPDIRNVSALEVLRNRTLQIDIYLLTYLHGYLKCALVAEWVQY